MSFKNRINIEYMKNFIKTGLVTLFSFCLVMAYGQTTRDVGIFFEVSASTNVQVKLIKSDNQKVEYKMISGDAENLVTEVKNNKLIIKIKNKRLSWNNKSKALVNVYYTKLTGIEASAGASIKSDELIYTTNMDVEVSSGAVADLEIEAESIDAEVSSGGKILLEGSAKTGDFEVSSGANLNASKMVCDNVTADASSGGNLEVHVNKRLKADASSGGSIRYKGNVEYTNTDSGWSGQIKRMH